MKTNPLTLVVLAAALSTATGCLEGDPNPYAGIEAVGTGGTTTLLRQGTPSGTPISPGAECSMTTGAVITLTVSNSTATNLGVYWVGYSCEENYYGALPAGGTFEVQTYEGHPYRFRNELMSELLFEYVPDGTTSQTVTLN
jgi:hypothetical protein